MACDSQHYFLRKNVPAAMIYKCSDDKVWNIHPWKVNDRSSANNQINNTVEPSDQKAVPSGDSTK
jgi:hypothetical protein